MKKKLQFFQTLFPITAFLFSFATVSLRNMFMEGTLRPWMWYTITLILIVVLSPSLQLLKEMWTLSRFGTTVFTGLCVIGLSALAIAFVNVYSSGLYFQIGQTMQAAQESYASNPDYSLQQINQLTERLVNDPLLRWLGLLD